jgi:hypothetical protein
MSDIWDEVKLFIGTTDRVEAAENLVSILIDNDYDVSEIRSSFTDPDVRRCLANYDVNEPEEDDEEIYDED